MTQDHYDKDMNTTGHAYIPLTTPEDVARHRAFKAKVARDAALRRERRESLRVARGNLIAFLIGSLFWAAVIFTFIGFWF